MYTVCSAQCTISMHSVYVPSPAPYVVSCKCVLFAYLYSSWARLYSCWLPLYSCWLPLLLLAPSLLLLVPSLLLLAPFTPAGSLYSCCVPLYSCWLPLLPLSPSLLLLLPSLLMLSPYLPMFVPAESTFTRAESLVAPVYCSLRMYAVVYYFLCGICHSCYFVQGIHSMLHILSIVQDA